MSDGRWGSCWTLPHAIAAAVIADALFTNRATRGDPRRQGLLRHGCGHWPANRQADASLIDGDDFSVELIARLTGQAIPWW